MKINFSLTSYLSEKLLQLSIEQENLKRNLHLSSRKLNSSFKNTYHLMQVVVQSVVERFENERHYAEISIVANPHHDCDAEMLHLTICSRKVVN